MKRVVLFFLVCIVFFNVRAQVYNQLDENLYKSRVKLVSEFFDRFNGIRSRPDVEESVNNRKDNILLLFDLAMFKSKQDSLFIEAESFAEKVLADSIRINYCDTTWCAKARCKGTLSGKPIDFWLYLNVENRESDMYKWVISKAEGNVFSLETAQQHKSFMLMPDDHEINFMSLYRMTSETPSYVKDYKSKGVIIDQTSVFFTMVKTGLLKIEYVDELSFLFFQIPGYMFSIKQVERENLNAGWLINSFGKISESEREEFLNWLHH